MRPIGKRRHILFAQAAEAAGIDAYWPVQRRIEVSYVARFDGSMF